MTALQSFEWNAESNRSARGPVVSRSTKDSPSTSNAPTPASAPRSTQVNLEGAYPLLLIGAAVLVYGVILALQVPPPSIGRFEIWQLAIVVGATILAAGIFSLYFATLSPKEVPETPVRRPSAPPPEHPRATPRPTATVPPSTATAPPWWEGPPPSAPTSRPRVASASLSPSATDVPAGPASSRRATTHPVLSVSPDRPPVPKADEIESLLTELDAISRELTATSAPRSPATPPKPRLRSCIDCGRSSGGTGPGPMCSHCGRTLCTGCAEASLLRTGDVTCQSCGRAAAVGS